jgi:alpha-glucosidase
MLRTGFLPIIALSVISIISFAAGVIAQNPTSYTLTSPNSHIELNVQTSQRLTYDVLVNGKPVISKATLSIDIDHTTLGLNPKVTTSKPSSVDREISCPVPYKTAKLREAYKELRLEMAGNFAVVFRAYNEGVAYRFETTLGVPNVKVYNEEAGFNFNDNYHVYYPKEESFFSHNEREFLYLTLKDIPDNSLASLPAVVQTNDGINIAVAESDVDDYPGLWLHGNSNNSLSATFPHYPLKEDPRNDRDIRVAETADYIATTKGTRTFPWRILGIAENDSGLITNQLVYLLAKPSEIQDTSWIKPGKVAWDWYNANNIWGVDFKSGINTQTYKYYIDFASKYGLDYVILDEGWYKLGNVLEVVPEMNVEELVAYGKQKKVGIILWVIWKTLDNQFDAAFAQYEKWGIKGLKIDFMQRDDQPVMNFYQRVCREAAKRKMLLDFHGAIRPATFMRTWPNVVNTEGVRGLEQNKWSKYSNPEHNVTIPFTRMFLGPLDYTPGAMVNSGLEKNFVPVFERPMSPGTRCHQLAMYVVYEAPLQMLADSPTRYLQEPEIMQLLGAVPTTWDETRVLAAKVGDYVAIARRHRNDWYIGAMTDWTPRDLELDLSFLPAGSFQMTAYQDGANSDRLGADYKQTSNTITKTTKLKIHLASGGGWAAVIRSR